MFVEKSRWSAVHPWLSRSPIVHAALFGVVSVGAVSALRHTPTPPATPQTPAMRTVPPPPGQPGTLHLERDHAWHPHWLRGVASWYGDLEEGRLTASGEVFHRAALTACHPTLPFGTLVRVINLHNHRSVVVRINDRGALRPHRIIDLSTAAASAIGLLNAGVAPVKLVVLARAEQPAS